VIHINPKPIGFVRSPYTTMADAPHQGRFSDQESDIVIYHAFGAGLRGIEHHPNLIVLSWFDRAERNRLTAIPPHDPQQREQGVFATRSPNRPNPIGFCVVDLIERNGRILRVRGLDAIDGTPVLDIKPYSHGIDCVPDSRAGSDNKEVP
jgi:tRNA (adenine37-N6)-methyltransferase